MSTYRLHEIDIVKRMKEWLFSKWFIFGYSVTYIELIIWGFFSITLVGMSIWAFIVGKIIIGIFALIIPIVIFFAKVFYIFIDNF